ncbi:MAG: prepilin-type N-terminal cleavage/methylation domain-containing protein [Nitrospirae bacterium]|nr:prepilin-type N-terminal cleavage/methylation domain-containing protein [Nitrospirota bacterium]
MRTSRRKTGNSPFRDSQLFSPRSRRPGPPDAGFTLLEVLVAMAVLGIAVTLVIRLFSADMRAIATSEDYVAAAAKAEAKMRDVLDDDGLTEKTESEVTDDGYRIDVSVASAAKERTEDLQMNLLDITLTIRWTKGAKERSLTLRTLKAVPKQV